MLWEISLSRDLATLVLGEGPTKLLGYLLEQVGGTGKYAVGAVVLRQVAQKVAPARLVDQGELCRADHCSDNQITSEVTDLDARTPDMVIKFM